MNEFSTVFFIIYEKKIRTTLLQPPIPNLTQTIRQIPPLKRGKDAVTSPWNCEYYCWAIVEGIFKLKGRAEGAGRLEGW